MAKRQLCPEQLRDREKISTQCRQWLEKEMKRTGWNAAKVVEESGVSKQNISRVLKGQKSKAGVPPTFSRDTILKLAKAFRSPASDALEAIGLVSDGASSGNLNARKAAELMVKIPVERQPEALDYLQHLASKSTGKKASKRLVGESANQRARKGASKR